MRKAAIRWAISKTPAMNILLVSVLVVGAVAGVMLRREEFPRFELEMILITVPYSGASPDEVETGICQKIEEAVRSIDGLKKVTSIAAEGVGSVVLELKSDVPDVQKVLGQVESEVDRIPSFPDLAEEPNIEQITFRIPAIKIGVVTDPNDSPTAELELREVVEAVRDDLLMLPQVTAASIVGERDYQIDVEISETTLRKYGLSLQDVARRIRRENLELPGGKISSDSEVFLVRGKDKRLRGEEIAKIPLVSNSASVVLTVGDLGVVRDGFVDTTSISTINGRPGIAIAIDAAAREDLLGMTAAIKKYAAEKQLPPGYSFAIWDDHSVNVNDRLNLLKKNGLQGLVLVFIVLALFLNLRLSFWVALGIPVSILGACAVLWQFDQTMNMLSMFAFLIALGIVVDDAIVIGENIYAHRELGKDFVQAAVDGTVEVMPSVVTSVTTTIIAFVPMFFVTGVLGKFFAVLPLAVIAMLVISLFESLFILPCHLAHDHSSPDSSALGFTTFTAWARNWRDRQHAPALRFLCAPPLILFSFTADFFWYPFHRMAQGVAWVNARFGRLLDRFISQQYLPLLKNCLRRPALTISTSLTLLLLSVCLFTNGTVPWVFFPKLDAPQIKAVVIFPDGTPSHITDAATKKIEQTILAIAKGSEENGQPLVQLTHRLVGAIGGDQPGGPEGLIEGSHVGIVNVELVDNTRRSLTSQQVLDQWRAEVGRIPGVESVTFETVSMGPGGKSIEFKLLAPVEEMESLEAAVEACKRELAANPGVFDIDDDSRPGKWELQLHLKENAKALGVSLNTIAEAVRSAYYGEEVMRLQRGRHEVKLMVRYPEHERRSLANLYELRVDTEAGAKPPITELADIEVARGYSEINRRDQLRSITITADVDEATANSKEIVNSLKARFIPDLLQKHPGVNILWEGKQEQDSESINSLFVGFSIALLAMYVLLTFEFNSYVQPAIIMAVIPFGAIGALWGHAFMGIPLTLFSVLGLVALTGVVVNDSIVLVDFVNSRLRVGASLHDALMESGQRRFRPVLLTSLTTIAGLFPILTETSMQAQMLIPMATSLCFGLLLSTVLVLILVPTFYSIYGRFQRQGEPAPQAAPAAGHDDFRHDDSGNSNEIGNGGENGVGGENGDGKPDAEPAARPGISSPSL